MTKEQDKSNAKASKKRKKIGVFRRLAYVVGSISIGLLIGFLLAEIGLRAFGFRPERYPFPKYLSLDGDVYREKGITGQGLVKRPCTLGGHEIKMGEYVPGATLKVVYGNKLREYDDSTGIEMRINSLGFRGPEATIEKPDNVYRILGLGDSFAFGQGVHEDEPFLRQLESSLNKTSPFPKKRAARNIEVLNVGVQGYNTRDEVIALEHRWLEFSPDLVLITFYLNDAYADEAFWIRGKGLGIYLTEPDGLGRYSRLYDFAQHAYRCRLARQAMDEYYAQHYFTEPDEFFRRQPSAVDWHDCRQSLERATQLAKENDFRLALVIFPELHQLNDYPFDRIHAIVADACRELEIPSLDLMESFRGMNERELWCHPSDHHPNAQAHEIASKAIDKFLRNQIFQVND